MYKSFIFMLFSAFLLISDLFPQSKITGDSLVYSQSDLSTDYISLPSYKTPSNWEQVADDFNATSDWVIDKIIVVGADYPLYGGFDISFYTNKNGYPDSLIYSAENQPYSLLFLNYSGAKVTIPLDTPADLKTGSYFISVQYKDLSSQDATWDWTQVKGTFGGIAKFRNSSAYCAAWNYLSHCLSSSYSDMYFELYGTSGHVDVTDVAEDKTKISLIFELEQNYPNPFNPSTKISWQSPIAGHQTVKVYDVLGNEIAILIDEYRPAERYEAEFNAANLSSGTYFYQIKVGDFIQTKKMILVK